MRICIHAIAFAAVASMPTASIAQGFDPSRPAPGADRRVSVGIMLPLGGGDGPMGKPQLELRAVADHRATPASAGGRDSVGWLRRAQPREARIGMTLDPQPRLTVAGRELPEAERKLGISTVGWVAIGVAAAVVVGGLLFVDAVRDASE